jgi:hypothetical protein
MNGWVRACVCVRACVRVCACVRVTLCVAQTDERQMVVVHQPCWGWRRRCVEVNGVVIPEQQPRGSECILCHQCYAKQRRHSELRHPPTNDALFM